MMGFVTHAMMTFNRCHEKYNTLISVLCVRVQSPDIPVSGGLRRTLFQVAFSFRFSPPKAQL